MAVRRATLPPTAPPTIGAISTFGRGAGAFALLAGRGLTDVGGWPDTVDWPEIVG
jgi:hypothetical protein